jgi:hypothetical protein
LKRIKLKFPKDLCLFVQGQSRGSPGAVQGQSRGSPGILTKTASKITFLKETKVPKGLIFHLPNS